MRDVLSFLLYVHPAFAFFRIYTRSALLCPFGLHQPLNSSPISLLLPPWTMPSASVAAFRTQNKSRFSFPHLFSSTLARHFSPSSMTPIRLATTFPYYSIHLFFTLDSFQFMFISFPFVCNTLAALVLTDRSIGYCCPHGLRLVCTSRAAAPVCNQKEQPPSLSTTPLCFLPLTHFCSHLKLISIIIIPFPY